MFFLILNDLHSPLPQKNCHYKNFSTHYPPILLKHGGYATS
jgi:hypothetical protein